MSTKKNNIEIMAGASQHKRGRSNSGVQLVINANTDGTSKLEISPISTMCSPRRKRSTSVTLRRGLRPSRRGSIHHTKSCSNEPSWAKDLNFNEMNSIQLRAHHFSNHRTKSPTIDEEDTSDVDGESGDSDDHDRKRLKSNGHGQHDEVEKRARLELDKFLKPTHVVTVTPQSIQSVNSSGGGHEYPVYLPTDLARHSVSLSSLTLQRSRDHLEVSPGVDSDHDRSPGARSTSSVRMDSDREENERTLEVEWQRTSDHEETSPKKTKPDPSTTEIDDVGTDTIELSPIEESTLSKLSRVQKVDFQYGTHGPEYVKRFNGRKIRVGFRKRTKEWTAKHMQHPHSLKGGGKVEYNAVYNGASKSERQRLQTLSQVDEDSGDSMDSHDSGDGDEEEEESPDSVHGDGLASALERLENVNHPDQDVVNVNLRDSASSNGSEEESIESLEDVP